MQGKFIKEIENHIKEHQTKGNQLVLKAEYGVGTVCEPKIMGKEIIPDATALIRQAEQEVLFMGFKINQNCDASNELINALETLNEKARRKNQKIRVRILINSMKGLASSAFKSKSPSIEQFQNVNFEHLDFQYCEHSHEMFGSYHSKQIIIDNHTAILCSGDFGKDKNYKNETQGVIDTNTKIKGEMVNFIREDFIDAWHSSSTQPLIGEKLSIPKTIEQINIIEEEIELDEVEAGSSEKTNVPMLYLSKAANEYLTKRNHLSPTILALIKAIEKAESSINIMTPNFNIPEVMKALAQANARGVEINLIMTKGENHERENMPFMGGDNEKGIKQLFSQVRKLKNHDLSKLHVRWNTDKNKIVTAPYELVMHTKLVCIDDVFTMAGSSVLDLLCAYHPRENDICMESADVTAEYMKKVFDPVFSQGSEVFVDTEGRVIFTLQEVLQNLTDINKNFINIFEHKKQNFLSNETNSKKNVISGILGDPNENDNSGTLYELQHKTDELLEKNSNQITINEMQGLIECYQKITQKISESNLDTSEFVRDQGVFYQIKTFLSDVVRKFLNLKDDLNFAKSLTTHSLMNHLNEEILTTNNYLAIISPHYKG